MEGERRGKGGAAERLRKPSGVPFWHKTPVSPTLSILNRCLGIPLSLSLPAAVLPRHFRRRFSLFGSFHASTL